MKDIGMLDFDINCKTKFQNGNLAFIIVSNTYKVYRRYHDES